MYIKPDFREALLNPPKSFRPVPFWSWNEALSVEETRRQIAEMDRVGIGGYFMHARGGLQTPYMGDDWMANVEAGIREGEQRGMGAWAYDENGWPSGFGDGRVNGLGEHVQQKYLRYEEVSAETRRDDGRTIAVITRDDGQRLHFYYDVNPFYVDTLDPAVTRLFLETIYEPYHQRFGDALGAAMPGFFTDEPQVSRNGIPWSLTLPDRYRETYAEDLLPLLPQLVFEVGEFRRTRYRFWHLVQELFVVGFTQQIYEWCTERGAKLTGHMVLEETLLSQITSNAAVMPHYEFFHVPGMDWLGRHIDPPTTPLQVASVAHQLGIKQVLSETFALTGWNVSFEELRWMFDWQMVRGVTLLCQHLEGYSLRGIRKRDYPPSLFFQQPWWDKYRLFNDMVSRLGMLLGEGEADFDVLVIHPQASAWLHFDNAENRGVQALNDAFLSLTRALEAAHVPFDYGDERILRRHGHAQGGVLRVGRRSYRVVVVPPCDTLARDTVSQLAAFSQAGGTLIWVGRQPELVEGEACAGLATLCSAGARVASPGDAIQALPESAKPFSVTDEAGEEIAAIALTWRRLDAAATGLPLRFFFLANADTEHGYDAVVRVPGRHAVLFDAATGHPLSLPFTRQGDGRLAIPWRFPRRGSLALLVSDQESAPQTSGACPSLASHRPLEPALLAGDWRLEILDPNALTLDTCDVWFDGVLQAENEHVSVIQTRALDLKHPVDVTMRFHVRVADDFEPPADLCLVMEQPDLYGVTVNGRDVPVRDAGHYRDTSFRKIGIGGSLRSGANEIVLQTRFEQSAEVYANLERATAFEAEKNKLTYDSEIEAVYLIGSFGVATPGAFEPLPRQATRYTGEFVLSPVPEAVTLGDLVPQGLPFFNGTVRLSREINIATHAAADRCFAFAESMASVIGLNVNGQSVHEWYWRPFEADLNAVLRPGRNTFTLELTNNLRNLLGPHHLQEGESYAVAPPCFFKEPNIWGHRPWHEGYCFVEFGLRAPVR